MVTMVTDTAINKKGHGGCGVSDQGSTMMVLVGVS